MNARYALHSVCPQLSIFPSLLHLYLQHYYPLLVPPTEGHVRWGDMYFPLVAMIAHRPSRSVLVVVVLEPDRPGIRSPPRHYIWMLGSDTALSMWTRLLRNICSSVRNPSLRI